MFSTYKLNTNELTNNFISAIQNAYPNREVEILVHEAEDDTDYLLSSPANKQQLLRAIDDIKNDRNLVSVSFSNNQ